MLNHKSFDKGIKYQQVPIYLKLKILDLVLQAVVHPSLMNKKRTYITPRKILLSTKQHSLLIRPTIISEKSGNIFVNFSAFNIVVVQVSSKQRSKALKDKFQNTGVLLWYFRNCHNYRRKQYINSMQKFIVDRSTLSV